MKNKNSDITVSNNSNQNLLYNFTKIFKMKKNLFSLLLSTIITSYAFGQITLEHSFDTGEQVLVYSDTETLKYITLLGTQINIYNSDYSLFKTFSISLPPTSSRVFLSTYDNFNFNVSKHLFNTDDKLEFFVFYQGSVGNLVVFNEDGNVIKNFNAYYSYELIDVFHDSTTNTNKLKMGKYISGTSDIVFDIFSLPTSSLTTKEITDKNKLTAFPIPTNKNLNIINPNNGNNSLQVYDENGKIVINKLFTNSEKTISLDVEFLPKGIYIYKIGNINSKFLKN